MAPFFFNTPDDPIEAPETVLQQYSLGVREELSTDGFPAEMIGDTPQG